MFLLCLVDSYDYYNIAKGVKEVLAGTRSLILKYMRSILHCVLQCLRLPLLEKNLKHSVGRLKVGMSNFLMSLKCSIKPIRHVQAQVL